MKLKKAHPDVFNLLLQALDDGQMTDSLGRKIDFQEYHNSSMTSNIGSRQTKRVSVPGCWDLELSGRLKTNDDVKGVIENALRKFCT